MYETSHVRPSSLTKTAVKFAVQGGMTSPFGSLGGATSAAKLKVWVKIGDCHLFLRCFQDAFQALGILFERFFQLTLEHPFRYFEEALRFAFDVRGHFGARA